MANRPAQQQRVVKLSEPKADEPPAALTPPDLDQAREDELSMKELEPSHQHVYTYRETGIGTSLIEQCDCGAIRGVRPSSTIV